ncbi:hypothetical protein JG687_00018831 [Phytophthora cactorum]|uniref:Uncharacterized protein n=1 Tax=Phytophthora cactorum TaxID=29920 RepID=A0A8T1TK54_9STRA|nr:hypothetical protein JG687_00018831 [Phytophthora cactorum]
MRVSPYPLRVRTTPQGLATPLCARSRTPTSGGPRPPAPRRVTSSPLEPDQFQLIVKPIVKNSVGQNETSGDTLSNFLVDGSTFQDILGKLRETFSHRIKERAVKQDGVWSMEPSTMSVWTKLMQFKYNNHIVDNRAGATAEHGLREVVSQLQAHWESSFRAETIVWRMWGNHITRNLDRSTWNAAITDPTPGDIIQLLRPRPSGSCQAGLGQQKLALACVNASIADSQQLRQDVEALVWRLDSQDKALASRK